MNEKATELVGRIHDWEFRHPWIARPFWYFALLVAVLGVCHGTFNYFDLYHTDADSARYMLSAMVQAQAAIVAIVITLTLIAVQLTASAYSPRVIRVFKNNPDMWILLVIYGFSMLYGLVVLKMVGGVGEAGSQDAFLVLGFVPMSFECYVSVAYWLQAFTFVALFPYMLNIIDLLKPENIINRLVVKITEEGVLNSKEDSIQPIMDIIHGAVMKYDLATTRIGLEAVTDRVIEIIDSNSQKKISRCFCEHIGQVGRLTASKMDADSSIEVVKNLYNFWESTAAKKFEFAASQAALSLELFGNAAIDQKFEFAARHTIRQFELIGRGAIKNEDVTTTRQAVEYLEQLGLVAAVKGLEATRQAIESLELVGTGAIAKGAKFDDVVKQAVWSLGSVGITATRSGLEDVARKAAESLGRLGITVAANGDEFGGMTKQVIQNLVVIVVHSRRQRLERTLTQAVRSLAELTISSEELVNSVTQVLEQLEQDHDAISEPLNIYKQELEKLLTQNPHNPRHQ